MTLDVDGLPRRRASSVHRSTWALNEASVEKAARERMLEVVVEIDGRPLSRWGCDGVVCATPTGSTAYAFSAGGPIVWPEVEALLMVPISAHALFARPLVVAPTSVLAVEVIARTDGAGVLWCDGRRTVDLPPGARIEVRRGRTPVRLARLHEAPFTDRLVAKFDLPVERLARRAERTPRRRAATGRRTVLEEMRITSLGVIEESVLELGPGFTAVTGETGAGKTMVVTALGLLLGGRADSGCGAHRRRRSARSRGWCDADAERRGLAGGRRRGRRRARGRPAGAGPAGLGRGPLAGLRRRASRAGRPRCAELADPLVAVHGQSDQHRLLQPARSARRSTASPGPRRSSCGTRFAAGYAALRGHRGASSPRWSARRASGPGRPTCSGSGSSEVEAVDPRPGRTTALAAEETRLGFADTLRTRRRAGPRGLSADEGPDALGAVSAARKLLDGVREHDPEAARRSPTGSPRSATCSPTSRPTWRRTPPASTPTRPGWPRSRSGGRRSSR